MSLNILTRAQFTQNESAAMQAALPGTFIINPGSILLAFIDGHSATAMWLQSNLQLLYNRGRLSTSTNEDVDSFLADYGVTRPDGIAASGQAQFASLVASAPRTILVGAMISTPTGANGTITFEVIKDTTNSYWNNSINGYIIPAGIGTVSMPVSIAVQCTVAGTIGNVQANTVTLINSPITGIDTVTNTAAFTNGQDTSSDPQARAYFIQYLNSLYKANNAAISFAVQSVSGVTQFLIVENTNYSTQAFQPGYFYVVINDGTGTPSSQLIQNVSAAIEPVRGLTITYNVIGPVIQPATIVGNIVLPSGYSNSNLISDITAAIQAFVINIPLEGTLYFSRLYQVIYDELLAIVGDPVFLDQFNINSLTLNGSNADLVAGTNGWISASSITITTS